MSEEKKLIEEIPLDPTKPDTKSNFIMVVAIIAFLAIAAWFVVGVAEDPPESVEEATEVVP